MKSKLELVQADEGGVMAWEGWMVVESDRGIVLVDGMTKAKAEKCLKRLDGYTARVLAPFLVPLEEMVEEKVEQMLDERSDSMARSRYAC